MTRADAPRPTGRTRARLLWPAVLALLLCAGAARLEAQAVATPAVSDTLYEVRLADGGTYVGRIVAVQGETVTLESAAGVRIQFTRAHLVSIRPAQGRVEGESFWREDPNRTRLFFSPTGRGLEGGTGYVGVYELFIPFVTYALNDRLTVAGGSPFYLAFWGDGTTPPLYFGPKLLVVDGSRFQASVGALTVVIPDDGTEVFGIAYGVGTYGDADDAVTGGLGWGYVGDDFSSRPLVMLGGETRTGRMTKLITENLFVPGEGGLIVSGGIRFFGERLSADLGLAGLMGEEGGCCLPLVDVVYHFGRGR